MIIFSTVFKILNKLKGNYDETKDSCSDCPRRRRAVRLRGRVRERGDRKRARKRL